MFRILTVHHLCLQAVGAEAEECEAAGAAGGGQWRPAAAIWRRGNAPGESAPTLPAQSGFQPIPVIRPFASRACIFIASQQSWHVSCLLPVLEWSPRTCFLSGPLFFDCLASTASSPRSRPGYYTTSYYYAQWKIYGNFTVKCPCRSS